MAPTDAFILRTHLEVITPLDMMRCQALVSPPRALVLIVGYVGPVADPLYLPMNLPGVADARGWVPQVCGNSGGAGGGDP